MRNILVTSISSKTSLINCIRENVNSVSKEIIIYGSDTNPNCIAKYLVDDFYQLEKFEHLNIDDLIRRCLEWSILLIIPTRDDDVLFFSKNRKMLETFGINVMASNYQSVVNTLDKYLFFKSTIQYNSIKSFIDIKELNFDRYVVKERFGSGSKNIGINLTKNQAIKFAKNLESPLFQNYISGEEISIDAYVDKLGMIKGLVLRKRDLIINGEAHITTTFSNINLELISIEIINHLKLYGHIMLQMFITAANDFFLIECNPRFGGASTISIKAGLNSFKWAYLEAQNIDISKDKFIALEKPITQIKISSNIYI